MKLWRYGCAIEQLGHRYRLEGVLGSGGMADVCLAWDTKDERYVAIKVIKSDYLDQDTLNRFLAEASHITRLDHPNILHVYDDVRLELVDVAKGSMVPYLVTEYAEGGDLQHRLTSGSPYPFQETLRIFEKMCHAVYYAHEHGVMHRDLKPSNILFLVLPDGTEQPVLGDFGLAVALDASHHTFSEWGTPAYMAPEQLEGKAVLTSDIFALGVILYQLCTGQLPFPRSMQDLHLLDMPDPPYPTELNPALPPALDDVILQALDNDPNKRFADADQLWLQVQRATDRQARNQDAMFLPTMFSTLPVEPPPAPKNLAQGKRQKQPVYPEMLNALTAPGQLPARGLPPPPVKAVKPRKSAKAHSHRNRALFIIVSLLILAVLAWHFMPNMLYILHMLAGTTTTITIAPDVQHMNEPVTIVAVPGTPDSSQSQVQARFLTSMSPPQSKTVPATGKKQTPATAASGILTFSNASFSSYTIPAGQSITVNGITVIPDTDVYIPASSPDQGTGIATVSAHFSMAGTIGNITVDTINGSCCPDNTLITVQNTTAFTGGHDPQTYTVVQQSDIDNANATAALLMPSLSQSTRGSLLSKKQHNELFVNTPDSSSCKMKTIPDHAAGDRASSVTVSVTVTCTAEVYDADGAKGIAKGIFMRDAIKKWGTHYKVENVHTIITHATVIDNQGTVSVVVAANGILVYQFTDALKQQLAKAIVGKKKTEAERILKQYGAGKIIEFNISNGSDTVSTDASQVTINIQNISGVA